MINVPVLNTFMSPARGDGMPPDRLNCLYVTRSTPACLLSNLTALVARGCEGPPGLQGSGPGPSDHWLMTVVARGEGSGDGARLNLNKTRALTLGVWMGFGWNPGEIKWTCWGAVKKSKQDRGDQGINNRWQFTGERKRAPLSTLDPAEYR